MSEPPNDIGRQLELTMTFSMGIGSGHWGLGHDDIGQWMSSTICIIYVSGEHNDHHFVQHALKRLPSQLVLPGWATPAA